MKIDTVYVPAGKYVIGDPCYTVPDADWHKLLESCDYFNRPIGISGGFEVLAFPTKYGDGVYRDQVGRKYPVDAGLIGCILLSDIQANIAQRSTKVKPRQNASITYIWKSSIYILFPVPASLLYTPNP